jgi:hypothetical protein
LYDLQCITLTRPDSAVNGKSRRASRAAPVRLAQPLEGAIPLGSYALASIDLSLSQVKAVDMGGHYLIIAYRNIKHY